MDMDAETHSITFAARSDVAGEINAVIAWSPSLISVPCAISHSVQQQR